MSSGKGVPTARGLIARIHGLITGGAAPAVAPAATPVPAAAPPPAPVAAAAPAKLATPAPAAERPSIEVIKGTKKENVDFP